MNSSDFNSALIRAQQLKKRLPCSVLDDHKASVTLWWQQQLALESPLVEVFQHRQQQLDLKNQTVQWRNGDQKSALITVQFSH
jgi:hypothetical protein